MALPRCVHTPISATAPALLFIRCALVIRVGAGFAPGRGFAREWTFRHPWRSPAFPLAAVIDVEDVRFFAIFKVH
jgi:hypothetical protein